MVKGPAEMASYAHINGQAAQKYLTPHEKQALAEESQRPNGLPAQFAGSSLANEAGLFDICGGDTRQTFPSGRRFILANPGSTSIVKIAV